MATAMLDFREQAALHGHRPESYRERLLGTLLEIWLIALDELRKDPGGDEPGAGGGQ